MSGGGSRSEAGSGSVRYYRIRTPDRSDPRIRPVTGETLTAVVDGLGLGARTEGCTQQAVLCERCGVSA